MTLLLNMTHRSWTKKNIWGGKNPKSAKTWIRCWLWNHHNANP